MEENQIQIPEGWRKLALGKVLRYAQPYSFIVKSTNYDAKSGTPVLTAGKSFILGYTNETDNIYSETPVIIFDDFTTDTKFVDFPFKVKSSAMKFLKAVDEKEIDLKYAFEKIQTIKITETGGDHKRRWISEYSKIEVLLPEFTEQQSIADILSKTDQAIANTEALIAKYSRIKTGLMQDLLTKGIDENGNIRTEQTHEFKDSPLGRIPKEWVLKPLGKVAIFNSGYAFKYGELTEDGYKVVRISNLHKPEFPYWHYNGPLKETWIAKDGDILFTWAGVATSIDCIEYKGEAVLLNQHIYNFIFKDETIKYFTYKYLQSFLPKLRLEIEGGAGQLHLTKDKIQSIQIPIMEEEEMKAISEKFKKTDDLLDNYQTELTKLQSLKTGLMQDLLSGKVRVNNVIPGDNLSPHKTNPLQIVTSSKQQ